jgi:hypothetical protein
VPVAKAADLDACLPGHQRTAVKHGVGRLDQIGVGTDLFHIAGHVEHQPELVETAEAHAAVVVPVPGREFPHGTVMVVTLDHGGVDHKISALEGVLPVRGLLKPERGAEFVGVADGHGRDRVEAFLIDVHERDLAAFQILRQAEVFDQAEGEGGAAGADDADANGSGHGNPPY